MIISVIGSVYMLLIVSCGNRENKLFVFVFVFVRTKFLYALVESRRKSVLAHAAQFCRAGARIKIRVVFSPFSNFSRFKQ